MFIKITQFNILGAEGLIIYAKMIQNEHNFMHAQYYMNLYIRGTFHYVSANFLSYFLQKYSIKMYVLGIRKLADSPMHSPYVAWKKMVHRPLPARATNAQNGF